jgi:hypothetical protein
MDIDDVQTFVVVNEVEAAFVREYHPYESYHERKRRKKIGKEPPCAFHLQINLKSGKVFEGFAIATRERANELITNLRNAIIIEKMR